MQIKIIIASKNTKKIETPRETIINATNLDIFLELRKFKELEVVFELAPNKSKDYVKKCLLNTICQVELSNKKEVSYLNKIIRNGGFTNYLGKLNENNKRATRL